MAAPEDSAAVEDFKRLSESILWRLQRASYTRQGPSAWREGGLPLQITNNPFIAEAYARVIYGFLQDQGADSPRVDVVELCAGSGRFGFLMLKALAARCQASPTPLPAFRVILTDLAQANVDAWQRHPRLRPFFEQGILDVARFDLTLDF